MIRMRGLLVILMLLIGVAPTLGADWSLGSNLGLCSIRSEGLKSGSTTVFAIPGNVFGFEPGLRMAIADTKHANELYLDAGVFLANESGTQLHIVQMSANYQHAWATRWGLDPFANIGGGLLNESSDNGGSTAASVGAGLGVRHIVGHRHGSLRAETRVDHYAKNMDVGRPALTVIELRLGFDLWMR